MDGLVTRRHLNRSFLIGLENVELVCHVAQASLWPIAASSGVCLTECADSLFQAAIVGRRCYGVHPR